MLCYIDITIRNNIAFVDVAPIRCERVYTYIYLYMNKYIKVSFTTVESVLLLNT